MEQSLEEHLRQSLKNKQSDYFLTLVQQVKTYIDARMSELAGKNEEERAQGLHSSLVSIRDLMNAELSDYSFRKLMIDSIDTYTRTKEIEKEDLEKFKDLNSENQKKNEVPE